MKANNKVCIVGAGFSGVVIARELAEAGIESLVIDERNHLGGNCHTKRDEKTEDRPNSLSPKHLNQPLKQAGLAVNISCLQMSLFS